MLIPTPINAAWLKAVTVFGVPSLIAIYLVWLLGTLLGMSLPRIESKIDRHETNRAADMQAMNSFLYAICLNGAEMSHNPDLARARCAVALDAKLATR